MTQPAPAVPIIYAPLHPVPRLHVGERIGAAIVASACLSVLLIAAWLEPSHNGVSSHTQLGMARCEFLERTGLPCPSCGMTTSFALFAHGHLLASAYVQPMGFVLAILTAAGFWIATYITFTGKPVLRLLRIVPLGYYFTPLVLLAIGAWGWKIYIHLHGLDGW